MPSPRRLITTARTMMSDIFTSSVGWKLAPPMPSHLFFPLASMPNGVNMVRNMVT